MHNQSVGLMSEALNRTTIADPAIEQSLPAQVVLPFAGSWGVIGKVTAIVLLPIILGVGMGLLFERFSSGHL